MIQGAAALMPPVDLATRREWLTPPELWACTGEVALGVAQAIAKLCEAAGWEQVYSTGGEWPDGRRSFKFFREAEA